MKKSVENVHRTMYTVQCIWNLNLSVKLEASRKVPVGHTQGLTANPVVLYCTLHEQYMQELHVQFQVIARKTVQTVNRFAHMYSILVVFSRTFVILDLTISAVFSDPVGLSNTLTDFHFSFCYITRQFFFLESLNTDSLKYI